ncbi:lysis system i-spanin subunit Rz [Burkholderia sp. Ax-1724]|uniref:lysis system i-spanin subunit Rz n=1 Tax=Burkholderia sp. Ax-1724 TaxID=2608336 RepID=UPI001420D6FD|nr:lysis system i-spanin subunit Rz [Burkholderia sp. Ax-1724]NIF51396.1 lysozyme [Burkholderia sp. Ax-1724]
MNGYFLTGIASGLLGIAIGGGSAYTWESSALQAEKATHARDNEQHANDLNAISKAALDAEQRAIHDHTVAEGRITTLGDQLTKEKEAHEADNARNRAAIADGTRRLRIAVTNFHPAGGEQADTTAGSSDVGDGAAGTAELSRPFGLALFSIADDADADRRKVIYLQGYVCAIRPETVGCTTTAIGATDTGANHEQ